MRINVYSEERKLQKVASSDGKGVEREGRQENSLKSSDTSFISIKNNAGPSQFERQVASSSEIEGKE